MSNVTVLNADLAPSPRALELAANWRRMYGDDKAYGAGLGVLSTMAQLAADSIDQTLADEATQIPEERRVLLARRASETRAALEALRVVALR